MVDGNEDTRSIANNVFYCCKDYYSVDNNNILWVQKDIDYLKHSTSLSNILSLCIYFSVVLSYY